MNNIKCKLFILDIAWSFTMLYFPDNLSWKEIKSDNKLSRLNKTNYLGEYYFDEKYLMILDKRKITNKEYYYMNYIPN